jgi:hypothetical protein
VTLEYPITPTRCNPVMALSVGHWSVFKQLFTDYWDTFKQAHPRYEIASYDSLVDKMLSCGHADKLVDTF